MYSFASKDDTIEHGFREIACSQIELALSDLRDNKSKQGSAVHAARRRCKKLRGLLRLVRPVFPHYRHENASIRDAADGLSGARDAEVLVATFDGLFGEDQEHRDRFGQVREVLAEATNASGEDDAGQALEQFSKAMTALRQRIDHWSLDGKDSQALWPGLKATYRAARRGMATARDGGTPVHFHDWRKAVKYRGHHLALLRGTAPDILAAERTLVDALSETLGDHHNLALLGERLAGKNHLSADDVQGVAELARARIEELEQRAFGLGRQVLAERPAAMVNRMRDYWATWH